MLRFVKFALAICSIIFTIIFSGCVAVNDRHHHNPPPDHRGDHRGGDHQPYDPHMDQPPPR